MVFSIWALQLETGQLRVTEAHDLSELLSPLCQLFRKLYVEHKVGFCVSATVLFMQPGGVGCGSSLSPSAPALWSPLTHPTSSFPVADSWR